MFSKINFFLALPLALLCTTGMAQKRAFTIEDVYRVKTAYGITATASGKMAYTLSTSDLYQQKSTSNIYTADGRAVTTDGKSYAPEWSADGKYIYYTSSRSGLPQVWRAEATNPSAAVQLTDYQLGVQGAVVSPNGRYIAFAAEVDPDLKDADGSLNKKANETKAKNPIQAHTSDRLLFRHWTEYTDGKYWHIIVYDTVNKTYTDVTPGKFHSPMFSPSGPSGFVFSPDSRELCYLSNHDARPEASTNCDLWTVSANGGEAKNLTADNKAWDGSPQYSPDGRYIAYRFQRTPGYESDRFILGLYDRKTGQKRVLTEKFDNWVDDYKWTPDSKAIYFLGEERGYEPLYRVDLKNDRITKVIANRAIGSFDFDGKGGFYYTYSRTGKPSAIYHATAKAIAAAKGRAELKETQVTHLNDSLEATVDIRPSETMWIKGAKGDSVEVFIVKPHGFDPNKKYPLVINVHGGPQMQWMDSFRPDWQVYPGAGYVVAYPNIHGSTGYGQQFCRDISGHWGSYRRLFHELGTRTDQALQVPGLDDGTL